MAAVPLYPNHCFPCTSVACFASSLPVNFPAAPVPCYHHRLYSLSGEPLRISISDSLPSLALLLSRFISSFSFSSISRFLISLSFVYVVPVCTCVCKYACACMCLHVCVQVCVCVCVCVCGVSVEPGFGYVAPRLTWNSQSPASSLSRAEPKV